MCDHRETSLATSADWEAVCAECGEVIVEKKQGRGGARANAGRKAAHGEAKQDKNIALTPTLWAFLTRDGETAGSAIETHFRKTAAFKEWLKAQAAEYAERL
jgi:hypothetical protein